MAGYLLRKISVFDCSVCTGEFVTNYAQVANDNRYLFINFKSIKENMLIYPSPLMFEFVRDLEDTFSTVFPVIYHENGVLRSLVFYCEQRCKKLGSCSNTECKVKYLQIAALYMKVRIHHALKNSIIRKSIAGGKRNRKILKLNHI